MDSLLNKPVYNFTKQTNSQVYAHGRSNCCFISSFQIQMATHFKDFPSLKEILDLLYPNQTDAYTHFAQDFPAKWFKLKAHLIKSNSDWASKLAHVLLHISLPLKTPNTCVQLTFIDLNVINVDEVNSGKYDSLESSFSDKYDPDKTICSIIQYSNHFEPIQINWDTSSELTDLEKLGISESFFN